MVHRLALLLDAAVDFDDDRLVSNWALHLIPFDVDVVLDAAVEELVAGWDSDRFPGPAHLTEILRSRHERLRVADSIRRARAAIAASPVPSFVDEPAVRRPA